MLLLVRSRGVVFTAFITSTFSTTVKGQVMVLMMIIIIETVTDGRSPGSPSLLAMFVTLVKLTKEKFTLSNWKPNANQVCISKQQSLLVIQSRMKTKKIKSKGNVIPLIVSGSRISWELLLSLHVYSSNTGQK